MYFFNLGLGIFIGFVIVERIGWSLFVKDCWRFVLRYFFRLIRMLIRSVILYRYSTTLGVIFLFLIDDGLEIVA